MAPLSIVPEIFSVREIFSLPARNKYEPFVPAEFILRGNDRTTKTRQNCSFNVKLTIPPLKNKKVLI